MIKMMLTIRTTTIRKRRGLLLLRRRKCQCRNNNNNNNNNDDHHPINQQQRQRQQPESKQFFFSFVTILIIALLLLCCCCFTEIRKIQHDPIQLADAFSLPSALIRHQVGNCNSDHWIIHIAQRSRTTATTTTTTTSQQQQQHPDILQQRGRTMRSSRSLRLLQKLDDGGVDQHGDDHCTTKKRISKRRVDNNNNHYNNDFTISTDTTAIEDELKIKWIPIMKEEERIVRESSVMIITPAPSLLVSSRRVVLGSFGVLCAGSLVGLLLHPDSSVATTNSIVDTYPLLTTPSLSLSSSSTTPSFVPATTTTTITTATTKTSGESDSKKQVLSTTTTTAVIASTATSTSTVPAGTAAVDWKGIFDKASKKALGGGKAGASAAVVQVLALMWLRTCMNYQYRYGGTLQSSLRTLWDQGGVTRLYQGLPFALIQGPLTRFGDTAANIGILSLLDTIPITQELPLPVKTACGSIAAGLWRIVLMPIDASKTSMQVEGSIGLNALWTNVQQSGFGVLYRGSVAQAAATAVGHFPWFLTYNFLDTRLPVINAQDDLLLSLCRSAILGLSASCVSDCCSNSLRVIKTTKQTASLISSHTTTTTTGNATVTPFIRSDGNNNITSVDYDSNATIPTSSSLSFSAVNQTSGNKELSYAEIVTMIIEKDGIAGLLGRGLQTRLLTNAIQGAAFSVLWRYFQQTNVG